MNIKQTLDNVLVAFLAQGLSMLLSVIQSLLIPKLLGVTEFGYWQLFLFYASYVGVFHFGLNDGVYLLKGGQNRDTINRVSVKSQFAVCLALQLFFAVMLIGISFIGAISDERAFVITGTGIYLVLQNSASYLMYVLQAMNETKKSSYSTMVNRLSFLVPLLVLLLVHAQSFRPFIIAYIASATLQLIYCCWNCRDILCSDMSSFSGSVREAAASIRVGIKLMIANIASQLILGVLRLTIDAAWGIETFGKLSLSLSLVNFFLAFVSQAAMVLFPALRQSKNHEIRSFFCAAREVMGIVFPVMYLLYFPMVQLLGIWLPAYVDSMRYFAWLIPICVFDSKMNIICTTIFKVRREESKLLGINIVATLACSLMVLFSVYYLGSVEAAMASATLVIICRSIYSERTASQELSASIDDVSLWEVVLTIAFVSLALMAPALIAILGYSLLYLIFLWLHRSQIVYLKSALLSQK